MQNTRRWSAILKICTGRPAGFSRNGFHRRCPKQSAECWAARTSLASSQRKASRTRSDHRQCRRIRFGNHRHQHGGPGNGHQPVAESIKSRTFVIGTGRHDSRRIDNGFADDQVAGESGGPSSISRWKMTFCEFSAVNAFPG